MATVKKKKITTVHAHPRHFLGVAVTAEEVKKIAEEYRGKRLIRPNPDDLDYKNGNKYDAIIAIWVDYFNGKFPAAAPFSPLDPDVVKALLGSESGFDVDPPKNKQALGIAQITRETLKVIQDPDGEVKDFIFKNIRQKDLKDPEVGIPMAVRWLFRKRETAMSKLKRPPTVDEIILEYKGMLKSNTKLKKKALENFRSKYDRLKKK